MDRQDGLQPLLFTIEGFAIRENPIRENKAIVRGIVQASPCLVPGFFWGFQSILGGQLMAHPRQLDVNTIVRIPSEGSEVQGGRAGSTKVF